MAKWDDNDRTPVKFGVYIPGNARPVGRSANSGASPSGKRIEDVPATASKKNTSGQEGAPIVTKKEDTGKVTVNAGAGAETHNALPAPLVPQPEPAIGAAVQDSNAAASENTALVLYVSALPAVNPATQEITEARMATMSAVAKRTLVEQPQELALVPVPKEGGALATLPLAKEAVSAKKSSGKSNPILKMGTAAVTSAVLATGAFFGGFLLEEKRAATAALTDAAKTQNVRMLNGERIPFDVRIAGFSIHSDVLKVQIDGKSGKPLAVGTYGNDDPVLGPRTTHAPVEKLGL